MISGFRNIELRLSPKALIATPGLCAGRLLSWFLGFILLAPTFFVLWSVVSSQAGESWGHVQAHLLKPAISNSIILVFGVGILSLLFGVPAAWCITHCQFPGRRLFSILLILPLAVPPYIAAYITTDIREAATPLLLQIRSHFGVEGFLRAELIHRYFWLMSMMAAVLFPYVFLACRAVFAGRARHLSEAGRLLGASPWRSFFTVELPLARPALIAGLFLVTMEVLSDYGATKHLGINTMTAIIFRTWFGLDELETARYLSGWMLLGIFLLLALERWLRGRARFNDHRTHKLPLLQCRKKQSFLCILVCAIPVFLGLVFPVTKLLQWHLTSRAKTTWADHGAETLQTITLAGIVTVACLVLSLLLFSVTRFSHSCKDRILTKSVSTAGYASPGTVMAVGVLGIAALVRGFLPDGHWFAPLFLSGSLLWLAFGLTSRYLAVSGQIISAGYQAIPPKYDQAARILGSKLGSIFFTIHLPLLRTPLTGAMVLVFVDVSKELPLTLLLRPFNFETLGTTAYSLANQGHIFSCATPSLILIGLSATGLFLVEFFGWSK